MADEQQKSGCAMTELSALLDSLRASPSLVRLSLNDVGRHEGVDAAAAALAGGDSEDDEGE